MYVKCCSIPVPSVATLLSAMKTTCAVIASHHVALKRGLDLVRLHRAVARCHMTRRLASNATRREQLNVGLPIDLRIVPLVPSDSCAALRKQIQGSRDIDRHSDEAVVHRLLLVLLSVLLALLPVLLFFFLLLIFTERWLPHPH